jgi:protein-tyrosine phosphatase
MTREHRAAVVSLVPRASRKTFTLREFDRLLVTRRELEQPAASASRRDSGLGLDEFVSDIAAVRGFSRTAVVAADDDITDPYRRSPEVYDEVGRVISASITRIVAAVTRA